MMDQIQPTQPLPKELKNSLYVHDITDDNIVIYAILLPSLTKDVGIIRPASDGKNLSYLSPRFNTLTHLPREKQETYIAKPFFTNSVKKRLLQLTYNKNNELTEIYFSNDTKCRDLQTLAQKKNLVLNLVANINATEETLEDAELNGLKQKINQQNLLNDDIFFSAHINKEDRLKFSTISLITLLKTNIYMLKMEYSKIALISKAQLIAAKNYTPVLQESKKENISSSMPQIMLAPPKQNKRKADNDANTEPSKERKLESDSKNSVTQSESSAGENSEQQNTNTTTGYSNS